jgi:hypothetical protein
MQLITQNIIKKYYCCLKISDLPMCITCIQHVVFMLCYEIGFVIFRSLSYRCMFIIGFVIFRSLSYSCMFIIGFVIFRSLSYSCMFIVFVWGSFSHVQWNSEHLGAWLKHRHCVCARVACCALMLCVHTHCEVQMVHWHQLTFLKPYCRKTLKYIWTFLQGYVLFNPLTRLFLVTSFYVADFVW